MRKPEKLEAYWGAKLEDRIAHLWIRNGWTSSAMSGCGRKGDHKELWRKELTNSSKCGKCLKNESRYVTS